MLRRIESGIAGSSFGFNSLSWVRGLAIRFGLKGIAFTKDDGSVKIIAEGEENDLVGFARQLQKGPISSTVENFYVKWYELNEPSSNFLILENTR